MASETTSIADMRPLYTSCAEHHRSTSPVSHASLPLTSYAPKTNAIPGESPFLRLPTELRLQIYSLLVLPRKASDLLPSYDKISASTQDYYDYEKKQHGTDRPATADLSNPTLIFRTIDPVRYPTRATPHTRTHYSVRCDRFRARLMSTTYHCVNPPNVGAAIGLLGANRQIHNEAVELLYSSYTFDFDTHVEAIESFLSDLTPVARSVIKGVRIVKRALAYEKEFDRCEWATAISALTSPVLGLHLRTLSLGVVAGKPGPNGWDGIVAYTAADFKHLVELEGMEWLRDLLEIRTLTQLDVHAVVEHCPPATNSMAMAGYIRFSASVESGLAEFLRDQMLVRA
ncbi:hypothetical protein LTR95_005002 [Oleoguttula sp. CCFEE 5521]